MTHDDYLHPLTEAGESVHSAQAGSSQRATLDRLLTEAVDSLPGTGPISLGVGYDAVMRMTDSEVRYAAVRGFCYMVQSRRRKQSTDTA